GPLPESVSGTVAGSALQSAALSLTVDNPPIVTAFKVNTTSIPFGDTVTISYTVTDDIGLKQVELWRTKDVNGAPDPNWPDNPIKTTTISGQTSYSNSFADTPPAGTYWYGIHVKDIKDQWTAEPKPLGPSKVVVGTFYDQLAEYWAPVWYQDTDSSKPRADYITNVNFDSDWISDNNKDNIDSTYPLKAYVYYWVVEAKVNTQKYWFIGYADFHPWDWKSIEGHENDMEGVLLVVKDDGSSFGMLEHLITLAHDFSWTYSGAGIDVLNARPRIYLESQGHGPYGNRADSYLYLIYLRDQIDNLFWYDNKNNYENFPGGDGIVYYYGGSSYSKGESGSIKKVAEEPSNGNDRDVSYDLRSIDELWAKRNDTQLFRGPFGAFNDNDGKAKPPWAWDIRSDNVVLKGITLRAPAFFYTPADVVAFLIPVQPFVNAQITYIDWSFKKTKMSSTPNLIVTSGIDITPAAPYKVGDTVTATFTLKNIGNAAANLAIVTAGGRGPGGDNDVQDFEHKPAVTVQSQSTYNYQGTFTLPKAGNYHFRAAYLDTNGDWNTSVQPDVGVNNFKDIVVEPQLGGPTALSSDIAGQPSKIYPNTVYSVTAKYQDPDGAANLKYLYLRFKHPTKPLTMMWHQPGDWYSPWEGEEGTSYLTIVDVTSAQITNGYQLTWKFKINDKWPTVSNAIDFGIFAWDDGNLKSGWNYDNTKASFMPSDTTSPSAPGIPTMNPPGPSSNPKPTLSWTAAADTGSGVAAYEVRIDGTEASFVSVGNVLTYTPSANITDGNHIFYVRAVDGAGNKGSVVSLSFTIDTIPPTIKATTLTSPNGDETWAGGSTKSITWTASDITDTNLETNPLTLEYTTDGTTWVSIATGSANNGSYNWRVPSINSSAVKVRIAAQDRVGLKATDQSNATFTIDSTPPTIPEQLAKFRINLPGTTTKFTWEAASDATPGIGYYEARIDSGTWTNIGNSTSYIWPTALAVGTRLFEIKAVDKAGNVGPVASLSFFVDPDLPTMPTNVKKVSPDSSNVPTFTWNPATDATSGVDYYGVQIDVPGIVIVKNIGSITTHTFTEPIPDGNHIFLVWGVDKAGDPPGPSFSLPFLVDTSPPTSPSNLLQSSASNISTPTFTWTASIDATSAIDYYQARIDSGAWGNIGNITIYTWPNPLADGSYTFELRAVDKAGNVSLPATLSFVYSAKPASAPSANASAYLADVMDQFHKTLNVYTDSDAAGNHFFARGRMSRPGAEAAVLPMDEASTDDPNSGITSIKTTFKGRGSDWGGWYFMNGALQGSETSPKENWGDLPKAGIDLQGASKLTFSAHGAKGGERVEFFAFGIGRNPDNGAPIKPYPDSSPKVSTGYITLSNQRKQYTIDLGGKDLSYVLGGFGWVTNAQQNGNQDITFYIDDIIYNKARLNAPRFLASYETVRSTQDFDTVLRNVAFTYDNAVALLAFLAMGEKERAKLLADALVYAQEHDRSYTDGRIRNAYKAGDLILPPAWTPKGQEGTVQMPGWYDATKTSWLEDKVQVSTYTGNVAWAMLALLAYYEAAGGNQYLATAERMGEWVETNSRDTRGAGGYTGGYEGWEPNSPKLLYKSTEHNIDLYAVFQRLYLITGKEFWRDRANLAKQFVLAMWDPTEGKFWTGTGNDGVTINKEVVPLDVQAWVVLALKDDGKPYWKALDYAEAHHKRDNGFDFNEDRDGIWYEGTAQMAVAYKYTGQQAKGKALANFLSSAQLASGALPAANTDGLTTGFKLPDGQLWRYYKRSHIGATAWLVLAQTGFNPFWDYNLPAPGNITISPSVLTTNNIVSFRWDAVFGAASYEVSIDSSPFSSIGAALTFTSAILPDGSHNFRVRAVDTYGTKGNKSDKSFVIDKTPPNMVNVVKTNPDNANTPTFAWAAADDSSSGVNYYLARLGTSTSPGTFANIGNVLTFTQSNPLANGSYVFEIKAVDKVGLEGLPSKLSFRVDTLATVSSTIGTPSVTPIVTTNDNTPTFTWTAVTNATGYEVSVDETAFISVGSVTSHTQPTALFNGVHTFQVRAMGSNNVRGNVGGISFRVVTSINAAVIKEITPKEAATALANQTASQAVGVLKDLDVSTARELLKQMDATAAANIFKSLATIKKADAETQRAAEIIINMDSPTAVNILKNLVTTNKDAEDTKKGAAIVGNMVTAKVVDIVNALSDTTKDATQSKQAGAIVENITDPKAAEILEAMPDNQKAGAVMSNLTPTKLVSMVQTMSTTSLMTKLPETSPGKLYNVPMEVLFSKLGGTVPTEQLVKETPPTPEVAKPLTEPDAATPTKKSKAIIADTGTGKWNILLERPVGASDLKIEKVMAKFKAGAKDLPVTIEDKGTTNPTAHPLPGTALSYSSINVGSSTVDVGWIKFKVEKSKLSPNTNIHKWSILLHRFDTARSNWVVLPTKLVDEDDTYVYYTATSSQFSDFGISGSSTPPSQEYTVGLLSVTPVLVSATQPVTVSATVTSNALTTKTFVVPIWVDEVAESSQSVTLDANQSIILTYTVSKLAPGAHLLRIDRSTGNFNVDSSAPSQPGNLSRTSALTVTTPTFTWTSATDDLSGIDHYEVKLDSSAFNNIGNASTYTWNTALSFSSHTFEVRAVDRVGNFGTPASLQFMISQPPPPPGGGSPPQSPTPPPKPPPPPQARIISQLAPISSHLVRVWSLDAATQLWKLYDPTVPSELNTLSALENGVAYWVKVKAPIRVPEFSIPLSSEEWNVASWRG
ncbi:MAG: PGF-pre-PGF domain-containing protein, partial [Chloroflexi bacterium]|nr:PGF-pre-PGF domain-containing protein [Chloroflexota bacterium]